MTLLAPFHHAIVLVFGLYTCFDFVDVQLVGNRFGCFSFSPVSMIFSDPACAVRGSRPVWTL
jgi:hypothetical protein